VQGYDPRGLAQYYRMFRTQLRKFSRLYQLTATVDRPQSAGDETASWTGNLPIVGFHAAARDFRDHLRRLAVEPSIDWIDCQARKDVMNFYPFDPIAGHGIDVGPDRCNPRIVPVRSATSLTPRITTCSAGNSSASISSSRWPMTGRSRTISS